MLARCAEAKFLRFADEIVKYARANSGMTIAMCRAFMKMYAYCHMYGKACDLCECIRPVREARHERQQSWDSWE